MAAALGWFALGLPVVGCGGSTELPGHPVAVAGSAVAARAPDPCVAFCDRSGGCRVKAGLEAEPGCLEACTSRPSPPLERLRDDYLWAQSRCYDLLDCTGIAAAGTAISGCRQLARHDLPPSPALRSFCADATRRGARCGQDPDQGDCLERLRIFTDEAVEHARGCLARSCDEVPPCLGGALFGGAR